MMIENANRDEVADCDYGIRSPIDYFESPHSKVPIFTQIPKFFEFSLILNFWIFTRDS